MKFFIEPQAQRTDSSIFYIDWAILNNSFCLSLSIHQFHQNKAQNSFQWPSFKSISCLFYKSISSSSLWMEKWMEQKEQFYVLLFFRRKTNFSFRNLKKSWNKNRSVFLFEKNQNYSVIRIVRDWDAYFYELHIRGKERGVFRLLSAYWLYA